MDQILLIIKQKQKKYLMPLSYQLSKKSLEEQRKKQKCKDMFLKIHN